MVLEDGHAFSADLFLGRCEASLSARLELNERDIGKMLTAMERFPDMTLEGLQRICKPQRPVDPSVVGIQTQSTQSLSARTGEIVTAHSPRFTIAWEGHTRYSGRYRTR
jgi:hypothetical protein